MPLQAIKFALVGCANTLLGLGLIYAGMGVFGLAPVPANALGYAAGALLGFVLNRNWTFRHEGAWRASLIRWLALLACAYAVNLAVVVLLIRQLGLSPYVAQLGGVVAYAGLSFLGARHFAFRSPPSALTNGGA